MAHKTLDRLERRVTCAKSVLCRRHHLAGVEQFEIQGAGQVRVVQPQLAFPHRVLVQPKTGQPGGNELRQCDQCLLARHRPAKGGHRAGVIRKAFVHQRNHLLRDGVRRKPAGRRQQAGALFAKAAAIVVVKVPLITDRFFALHQDAGLVAQLAVKIFQAQLLASLGVLGELAHGAEKVRVVTNLQVKFMLPRHGPQTLQHAQIAWGGHHQLLGLRLHYGLVQLAR